MTADSLKKLLFYCFIMSSTRKACMVFWCVAEIAVWNLFRNMGMPFHFLEKSCLHTLERGYSAHHHPPSTASTAHLNSSPTTGNKESCGTKGKQARRRRKVVAPSPSKCIPFTASHSASASSPDLKEHTSTAYHLTALSGQQYPSTNIVISKYQKTRN